MGVWKGLYLFHLFDNDLIVQKRRKGGPRDERKEKECDGAVDGDSAMKGGP